MSILGAMAANYQQQKATAVLEDYYVRVARAHASYMYARNWLRGKSMSEEKKHEGLPVAGYVSQSDANVKLVNSFKVQEENILRQLDAMQADAGMRYDLRWLSIGRTHLEQAFMAINRSVFKPTRVKLDEGLDKAP